MAWGEADGPAPPWNGMLEATPTWQVTDGGTGNRMYVSAVLVLGAA